MRFHPKQPALTLKSSHVAGNQKLEAGAGRLEKVLDVALNYQLVLSFNLLGAAGQVPWFAYLKVCT